MTRKQWLWIAVAITIATVIYLGYINPPADDETESDDDGDGDTMSTPRTSSLDPIVIVANAIQHVEGWYPGSRSYRNNNPGNLRETGALGQVGVDSSGMAIFDNAEDGMDALLNDLEAKAEKYPTMTINQLFQRYAPSQDGNNPLSYAAQVVAKLKGALGIGVTGDTNWSNLVNEYDNSSSDASNDPSDGDDA